VNDHEYAIKIAADDVQSLRRVDVFRVLDSIQDQARMDGVAAYITDARKDLVAEVASCLGEIRQERGWN